MTRVSPRNHRDAARICACLVLRKAARTATQFYDAALKPGGLRTTQYSLLITVAAQDPAGITRLADLLSMDQTTLTRNARVLLTRGLLASKPAKDDRRRRVLSVTKEGEAAIARAAPLWEAAQAEFVAAMGERPWTDLVNGLDAAREAARRTGQRVTA